VRHLQTTERALSGTTVCLSRSEQSRWRDKFTSVGTDDETREHICLLEEYICRLTGEIVEKTSRGYLSRAERSRWSDKVTSVGTDDETLESIYHLEEYVRRLTGEIVEKI
jgi:hypothetical protein